MSKLFEKKYLWGVCYLLALISSCLCAQGARQASARCHETSSAQKNFFRAIRRGNCSLCSRLSRCPSLVYARNEKNDTPLHVVAREAKRNGHSGMIFFQLAKSLLKYGAQVDAVNNDGRTPLELALLERHQDIAELLIRNGACVNRRFPSGETLLHWIIAREQRFERGLLLFRVLLNAGADVNPQDRNGETPLNYAVRAPYGYLMIPCLLRARARVDVCDRNGCMPLHIAAACGDIRSLKALIRCGADINAPDPKGKTSLHYVVNVSCSRFENDRNRMIEALVAAGADVNAATRMGKMPLHYATLGSYVMTLLRLGADLNIQDRNGLSPYFKAIKDGRLKVALVLLHEGAELDPPDGDYGEEFRQRCLTLDIIAFYRAQRHRVRHLSCDMQPEDHIQIQTEAGNALFRFLAGDDIYSETHLPTDLNVVIVSYLISGEAAENLVGNPTRVQEVQAWLRRWIP